MHMLEEHAVPWLRKWHRFWFDGWTGCQSMHAYFNFLKRVVLPIQSTSWSRWCVTTFSTLLQWIIKTLSLQPGARSRFVRRTTFPSALCMQGAISWIWSYNATVLQYRPHWTLTSTSLKSQLSTFPSMLWGRNWALPQRHEPHLLSRHLVSLWMIHYSLAPLFILLS